MLTVTCKINEGVQVGPDIRVVVRDIHGHEKDGRAKNVRLAVEAPRSVDIARTDRRGNLTRAVNQIKTALAASFSGKVG